MGPLLVVDIQPSFSNAFGANLTRDVLAAMRQVKRGQPIVVLSVNEELSGDTREAIQEFWAEQGMTPALARRVQFLEKDYAFFRGWMDIGESPDEIVETARKMRQLGINDSRQMPAELLEEVAPGACESCNPIFLPYDLESERVYQDHAWSICGGGRDECLREVELWMESAGIKYERLDHLTY